MSTDALREAVTGNNVDTVQRLVAEGGCDAGVRKQMWAMMLGAKEGTLREGEDVETSDMKMDVELMLQSCSGPALTAEEAEAVLIDYCTCRGVTYSTELTDLLGPLVAVEGISPAECAALLKAISHQFAPFLHYPTTAPIGEAELPTQVDTFNLLVRLLLQYHDAPLCTHLDRNKCDTGVLISWLNGLYVNQLGLESIHALWDQFISASDPLLPTFFGLSLLIHNRAALLEAVGEEAVTDVLSSMTIQGGAATCKNLIEQAQSLKKETPPSACMSAIKLFNPIGSVNQELHDELVTCVVLPVESEELIEAFKKKQHPTPQIKFMVLDCRAQKSYNFARLPTAVHIGPNVGYEPTKLSEMLERFEGARGSHFCLMGTGRGIQAEGNLLNVLALRFVSNGFSHIGIAVDGFKGVIPFIKADLIEFVRETTDPQPATPSKGLEEDQARQAQPSITTNIQAALKDVDTTALKKAANERADKVKKWGRGLFEKWTQGDAQAQPPAAPAGAQKTSPSAAQQTTSRFGGYFAKGQKQTSPSGSQETKQQPVQQGAEEPSFALLAHDSDGESDDFQLISHPTRKEGDKNEEKEEEKEKESVKDEPKKEEQVPEAVEAKKEEEAKADDLFGEIEPAKKEEKPAEPAAPAAPSPKKDVDIFADDFNIDDIELPAETSKKPAAPKVDDDLDDLFS